MTKDSDSPLATTSHLRAMSCKTDIFLLETITVLIPRSLNALTCAFVSSLFLVFRPSKAIKIKSSTSSVWAHTGLHANAIVVNLCLC
ncbi:hypothetical protein HanRHA438_Chr01g0008211 [Helianthus annuus]|nr:hypothetical protein HanRHA438_Chr01g0008211 [Helianthus annuus]